MIPFLTAPMANAATDMCKSLSTELELLQISNPIYPRSEMIPVSNCWCRLSSEKEVEFAVQVREALFKGSCQDVFTIYDDNQKSEKCLGSNLNEKLGSFFTSEVILKYKQTEARFGKFFIGIISKLLLKISSTRHLGRI